MTTISRPGYSSGTIANLNPGVASWQSTSERKEDSLRAQFVLQRPRQDLRVLSTGKEPTEAICPPYVRFFIIRPMETSRVTITFARLYVLSKTIGSVSSSSFILDPAIAFQVHQPRIILTFDKANLLVPLY